MWAARVLSGLVLTAFLSLASVAPAAAQGPSPTASPQMRSEFESLFAQSIRRPDDLELAFRFAEAASAIGDYEAAIGALERILFYNSGLGRVRLELGVLYFRLGSFAQSRSYFESVLAEPQTPPEVRARVESFLTELNRRDRTNATAGYLQIGVRHQSNANAAPNSLNIKIFGLDGLLSPQFRRRPDWNFFMLGGFRHIYDFENQRGDTWETTLQGYYTKQQRFRSLNLLLGEITSGPRLAVNPDLFPGFTFRPYIIANGLMLGDRAYSGTFGVGGSFQWSLPVAATQVEIGAEHRRRQFYASSVYVNADQQDGRLQTLFLNMNGSLTSWMKYAGRVYLTHNSAREDFNSFHQRGFDISFPIEFQGQASARGGRGRSCPSSAGHGASTSRPISSSIPRGRGATPRPARASASTSLSPSR